MLPTVIPTGNHAGTSFAPARGGCALLTFLPATVTAFSPHDIPKPQPPVNLPDKHIHY